MGDLSITLLEADSLIASDPNGASDPYCTITINGDYRTMRKSAVVKRSLAPVWNEVYEWKLTSARGALIDIRVFDKDRINRDDPLGAAAIMMDTLVPFVSNDMMLPLKGVRSGRIHLWVVWKPYGVAPPTAAKPVAMPSGGAYGVPGMPMPTTQPVAYAPAPAPTTYASATPAYTTTTTTTAGAPYYGGAQAKPATMYPSTSSAPAYGSAPPPYSVAGHAPYAVGGPVVAGGQTPPGMPSYSKSPMVMPGPSGPMPTAGGYSSAPTYGQPPVATTSYGAPATYGAPTAYGAPATYGAPAPYTGAAPYGGEIKTAPSSMPPPVMMTPGAAPNLRFFQNARQTSVHRNYMLVVDKSGSMAGANWREAVAAVRAIAPFVCRADPDGISLYFFSNGPVLVQKNVRTAQDVEATFARTSPGGSTDLTGVLQLCLGEHFSDPRKTPSTILVITDGEPDDEGSVRSLITSAANDLARDEDLSISFIQVGRAQEAARFLKGLDDNIRAKFDIVDTLSFSTMLERGISFEQMIALSVHD